MQRLIEQGRSVLMAWSPRRLTPALILLVAALLAACGGAPAGRGESEADQGPAPVGEVGQRITGAAIDASVQQGLDWVVPDTVSFVRSNGCAACHRVGAPLY